MASTFLNFNWHTNSGAFLINVKNGEEKIPFDFGEGH